MGLVGLAWASVMSLCSLSLFYLRFCRCTRAVAQMRLTSGHGCAQFAPAAAISFFRGRQALCNMCVCLWVLCAGQSIILMQLPALQDITALKNIQSVNGDIQLYLLPK